MIVQEWIVVFQQVSNCYVPTLILLFLFFFAWMAFIWSTIAGTGQKSTPLSAIIQIGFCGLACVGCGLGTLGFLITPDNTEAVFDVLGLLKPLNLVSSYVQVVLLWALKKLA
ncbi:MAG: hypothetical protein OZSIB_3751 [Candidatus Ozemobacter sibiricus]|uniref:Uncharacterized protein n=1 Tax=Candidatus Ozemobacter sibiricus TaxID=2268124 RepID=A0A367ZD29_9BACT|nr:MAG: hypothetical protein OZSIB_3751 [Candidatus Ozemobacter sibiricus]